MVLLDRHFLRVNHYIFIQNQIPQKNWEVPLKELAEPFLSERKKQRRAKTLGDPYCVTGLEDREDAFIACPANLSLYI